MAYVKLRPLFIDKEFGIVPLNWLLATFLRQTTKLSAADEDFNLVIHSSDYGTTYNVLRFGSDPRKAGIGPLKLLL